jgi:hypothetical protein
MHPRVQGQAILSQVLLFRIHMVWILTRKLFEHSRQISDHGFPCEQCVSGLSKLQSLPDWIETKKWDG